MSKPPESTIFPRGAMRALFDERDARGAAVAEIERLRGLLELMENAVLHEPCPEPDSDLRPAWNASVILFALAIAEQRHPGGASAEQLASVRLSGQLPGLSREIPHS